jgi:unsaturated rhamnogalacturonyl hydrolase
MKHIKGALYLIILTVTGTSCKAPASQQQHRQATYSQRMVETRALNVFLTNKKEQQLATAHWDYVSGLVAYSVLKAWQQYPDKEHYYGAVKGFADNCLAGRDTIAVGESNLDDLAAGKIFFALYEEELRKGNSSDASRYKHCAYFLRNKLKYKHRRIASELPGAGGFFHKAQYPNQMWLDGLYMGTAFYAEWQSYFGKDLTIEDRNESWRDIALQFKIIHQQTYDNSKKLNYHAWTADPNDANSFWAKKEEPYRGCSPEFWGRGMGWYFAALIDVLETMPKEHADYQTIANIARQVAEGLAIYQDKTGCWHQLLQYDSSKKADEIGDKGSDGKIYNQCGNTNYLESSASAMFTYAYLKGMRIGILDKERYMPVAKKAYQGLLDTFIRYDNNGDMCIIQSCASAGLGPAKDLSRTGTANYYLCGKDVSITQNEGKAIGPFIMASLEYELSNR